MTKGALGAGCLFARAALRDPCLRGAWGDLHDRLRRWGGDQVRSQPAGDTGVQLSNPGLGNPTGLALGPDGFLYVGDIDDSQIYRIDPNSGALTLAATVPAPLDLWDLNFDAQGRLLVLDQSANHLAAFNLATGALETIFDAPGGNWDEFAVARDGTIYSRTPPTTSSTASQAAPSRPLSRASPSWTFPTASSSRPTSATSTSAPPSARACSGSMSPRARCRYSRWA